MTPHLPLLEKYALTNSVTAAELESRSLTRISGIISAVVQGVSKKSNKPYAMVTLEDLAGTVSMLCINENYDKYQRLLVKGNVVLVVGEVNNSRDCPAAYQSIAELFQRNENVWVVIHVCIKANEHGALL